MANPRMTFIGADSVVFMKNIVDDILQRPALAGATIRLMDINPTRLEKSEIIAKKLIATLGMPAQIETFANQRQALDGTNFVVVYFQIGGYEPSTVVDFDILKRYNFRQTIADMQMAPTSESCSTASLSVSIFRSSPLPPKGAAPTPTPRRWPRRRSIG